MEGWVISIILFVILILHLYFSGVAFQNISNEIYNLCTNAGIDPEPILKKHGLSRKK